MQVFYIAMLLLVGVESSASAKVESRAKKMKATSQCAETHRTYTVKEDDTVSEILYRANFRPLFGVDGSIRKTEKLNQKKDLDLILPGQTLLLPGGCAPNIASSESKSYLQESPEVADQEKSKLETESSGSDANKVSEAQPEQKDQPITSEQLISPFRSRHPFGIWIGGGPTLLAATQNESLGVSKSDFATLQGNLSAGLKIVLSPKWVGSIEVDRIHLKVGGSGEKSNLDTSNYSWDAYQLEGEYRIGDVAAKPQTLVATNKYSLLVGLQYHSLPLFAKGSGTELVLVHNRVLGAAIGAKIYFGDDSEFWKTSEAWIRLHQGLSATSERSGLDITPKIGIDGGLGKSWRIAEQLDLGAYWLMQFRQLDYTNSSTATTTGAKDGGQNLFANYLQARLLWRFN